MRAAIYARVSCADGRQDAENQLAQPRHFAATQSWEIANEYIDHESGGALIAVSSGGSSSMRRSASLMLYSLSVASLTVA
jgi:DNA invertase Pin-like site-specific DNA recombinase